MARWYLLLLLPLCLLLHDRKCKEPTAVTGATAEAVAVQQSQVEFDDEDLLRQHFLAGLAVASPQSFPGSLSWLALQEMGTAGIDFVINYHAPSFLEMCLARYKQEVKGYSAILLKQERVAGKLQPLEKVEVHFREQPFSVHMNWLEGGVGLIPPQRVLYAKGENNDRLLARGRGVAAIVGLVTKDIHGDEAKSTGRYTIDQFGIYLGTERTLTTMQKAEARGTLHVEFQGLYEVPELGGRVCYKFVRTPYDPPEEEGVNELTIYIDKENWLQVGSVLRDVRGELIAKYFFRDLKINPEFKKDQFTRAAL